MDSPSTLTSSPGTLGKLSKKSLTIHNKSCISKLATKSKTAQHFSRNYRQSNCTPSTLRKVNNWISSLNTINDSSRRSRNADNAPCQSKEFDKIGCQIVMEPEYYYTEKEDKMLEDEIAQYCTAPFHNFKPHDPTSQTARDYVDDLFDDRAQHSNVKANKRRRLLQTNMVEKEVDVSDSDSDLPLSPESEKKKELCSYLQLMKPSDKKTIMILQNRRSVRVKNLSILQEKRELEKKLREESDDNLSKLPSSEERQDDKRDKWLKYRGQQLFQFPRPEQELVGVLKDFDLSEEDWFKEYRRQSDVASVTSPLAGFSDQDIDFGESYVKNIVNSTEELNKRLRQAEKSRKGAKNKPKKSKKDVYLEPDFSNNYDNLPSRANRYSIPLAVNNGICEYQEANCRPKSRGRSSNEKYAPIVEISAGIYDLTGNNNVESMLQADIHMKTKIMSFLNSTGDHPPLKTNNKAIKRTPSFKIRLKPKRKASAGKSPTKSAKSNKANGQKKKVFNKVAKVEKKSPSLADSPVAKTPKRRTKSLGEDGQRSPKKSSVKSELKSPQRVPNNGETLGKNDNLQKPTPKRRPSTIKPTKVLSQPKIYSSQRLLAQKEPADSFIQIIDTTVSPSEHFAPRSAVEMLSDMNSRCPSRIPEPEQQPTASRILAVIQYPNKKVATSENCSDQSGFRSEIMNVQKPDVATFISFNKETGSTKRRQDDDAGSSSWQAGSKRKNDEHSIRISVRENGPVLKIFYLDFHLIVCQESLVSFWTQTALGNILGSQDMWMSKGSVQRSINTNCIIKESLEMVVTNENSIAYVELWTKEHLSTIREGPVADIFAIVYFWKKGSTNLDKKVLQLENINGFADDVQYSVLKSSPKIIVSWHVASNEVDSSTTCIHSHHLAADFQSVCDVSEFEAVDHYVSSLHNIEGCETLIMGSGENRITLWNIESGDVAVTIEMSEIRSPLATLWVKCDRGFLFTLQQCVNREIRLIAIHGLNHSWKKLASYVPPADYDRLKSVCLENGLVFAFYEEGIVCWTAHKAKMILEAPHSGYDHVSGKYLINIDEDKVNIRHAFTHLLSAEES